MKHPVRCFAILAAILLVAACLPTGLPFDTKRNLTLVVGCLGAFGLGVARAKMLHAVPLTTGYIVSAIIIPGYLSGIFPGKLDPYSTFFACMLISFIVCFILFWSGRFLHAVLARRRSAMGNYRTE